MAYGKPPTNNIPFRFTESGYIAPNFDSISFSFGAFSATNLSAFIQVFTNPVYTGNNVDLSSLIRSTTNSYYDILASLFAESRFKSFDLGALLYGYDFKDLPANLSGWDSIDLESLLHSYAFKDISVNLHSWAQTDISASIGMHLPVNISAYLYPVLPAYLRAIIHGWDTIDLEAYLHPFWYLNLSASIRSTWLKNLQAVLLPILSVNLIGLLHGFDTYNLSVYLNSGYGPNDLQAYINAVPFKSFSAYIRAYKGIQIVKNLQAIIEGWNTTDLLAQVGLIYPFDLGAYIESGGRSVDLGANIIPNIILLKRIIQIPLMEYKDLWAIINFACFGSAYKDLSAYLYAFQKKDLSAFIIGWYHGVSDNLKDLKAYINAENYISQDMISLKFVPEINKYIRLRVGFISYKIFAESFANLSASITKLERIGYNNLAAYITPIFDYNYSELPEYIRPKTHEVFINLNKGEEQWRRYVELMFDRDGTSPFKYFYVNGTQKIYKIDRERHWTIWATGYSKVEDSIIERVNIRKKFIFKLSDYNTIDEAIRELMERAAYPSSKDLSIYIGGELPNHLDLGVSISSKSKHRWVKHLGAHINGL